MRKIYIALTMAFWAVGIAQQKEETPKPVLDTPKEKNPLDIGELKVNLNPAGDKWIKFGVNSQVWFRSAENNPGTSVNGTPQESTTDAGLRRMRITMQTEITPFYSVYLQIGINNQSFISGGGTGTGANGQGKKPGIFFHDAYNEFAVIPRKNFQTGKPNKNNWYIGGGLHSWNGVSRHTNTSTTKMLAYDIPVYNFPTIEISDQFSRQLGLFAHGEFDRVNYRFSVNKPFATSNAPAVGGAAVDNNADGKLATAGYAFYQFLDKETTALAFLPGNYMRTKKIFNVGLGFYHNKNGTLSQPMKGVFEKHDINALGADVTLELPVGNKSKEMGLTLYSVFYNYDYGTNYLRASGIMNPGTADAAFTGVRAMEGAGNTKFLLGTGNIWHTQAGFVLPKFSNVLKVQPYFVYARKYLKALNEAGNYFDIGTNFFPYGPNAKIVLNYGSKPIFHPTDKTVMDRKSEFTMMFQIVL